MCACLCVCVRDCVYVDSGWGGAVLNGGSIPSAYILEKWENPDHSGISIILGILNLGFLETARSRGNLKPFASSILYHGVNWGISAHPTCGSKEQPRLLSSAATWCLREESLNSWSHLGNEKPAFSSKRP